MSESQIIERSPTATIIRTGTNGQRLTIPNTLPILPIRNIVVFPGTVMPLNVGRQKSKNLLDEVMPGEKVIGAQPHQHLAQLDLGDACVGPHQCMAPLPDDTIDHDGSILIDRQ